jgi:hypothetical protein
METRMLGTHRIPRFATWLAAAGLVGLAACDGPTEIEREDAQREARIAAITEQTPVDIDNVYSGFPARDPGVINLGDEWVLVEILDVEQYLGRPASAADVRIGDSWEDGTPAADFQILDINQDGNRDIRVWFSLARLVDDGNLDENTEELEVWGYDESEAELYRGDFEVTVEPADPPGAMEDLVVVNDGNFFFDVALDFPNVDNAQFVRNVVNFENQEPRSDGTVVWWDRGRNSRTTTTPVRAQQVIADEGFSVEIIQSDVGDRFLDIPATVRSIWLWTPTVEFTTAEVNALKQFVTEGGRILFIGENAGFYGAAGMATMNNFFIRMGVSIRGISGTSHVGYQTSTNIVPHPLTAGVDALRWAGGGVLEVGPEADLMFYDMTGALLVGATEPIDPAPLTGHEVFRPFTGYLPIGPGVSETGQ